MLGVVVGRLVEAFAEVARERAEVGLGASFCISASNAPTLGRDRLEVLELPAFAGMQELVEQAHETINATGGSGPPTGRHRAPRAMRACRAMGTATGDRPARAV